MEINERSLITSIAMNSPAAFGRQESMNFRQPFDVLMYHVSFFSEWKHRLNVMMNQIYTFLDVIYTKISIFLTTSYAFIYINLFINSKKL
jgi:hypothetical protein